MALVKTLLPDAGPWWTLAALAAVSAAVCLLCAMGARLLRAMGSFAARTLLEPRTPDA